MFDTIAISNSFLLIPDVELLEKNGCKVFYSPHDGTPSRLALNGQKGDKNPRLTISKTPKEHWVVRAEVSVGDWLYGSNLFLPNERDIQKYLKALSEFVGDKTGIKFDSYYGRVTRLDVTRDFELGETKVLSVLKSLNEIQIPKYHRKPMDFNSVYFENKGKVKNKKLAIYSKYHDLRDKKASDIELDLSKGILRLEIEHKNNKAVSNLAKSLRLPNHNANHLLTRKTSESVIEKAMNLFALKPLLENSQPSLEKLGVAYNSAKPLTLAGHLYYKSKYGLDYGKLPFINLSEETIKRYDRECANIGILSLE